MEMDCLVVGHVRHVRIFRRLSAARVSDPLCTKVTDCLCDRSRRRPAQTACTCNHCRMSKIAVTHFTDPGCPFAYSASPALAVLRWRYGDQLDWRLVTIGLAEDPQRYLDAGYTPTRSTIGQQSYFKRFGMPLLMRAARPRHRHLARLPRDRRHAPAAPRARGRGAARAAAGLVHDAAAARRGRRHRRRRSRASTGSTSTP